jgi:penicillin-binding protein 1C
MQTRIALRQVILAVLCSLGCLFLLFLMWQPPLLEETDFSRAVFDRQGQLLRLTLTSDDKYRLYTKLGAISPQLRETILLHEDQHFYSHIGFNPVAIIRAISQTYFFGGRRIGASTITMQLVRLQHRLYSRSIMGKLWQIMLALQLEAHYSKDRIFEAYLNLAPYGANIEGIGAASYIYFHMKPSELTLPEATTLAIIPQSPRRRLPESGRPEKQDLLQARNRLFERWQELHPDDLIYRAFYNLPMTTYDLHDLPFEAPHLTRYLLARDKQAKIIVSTVDVGIQRLLRNILVKHVDDRRSSGILNASALLVDTRNMNVVASIGSADFWNANIYGQVDGTNAKRSPGSTLKPFIYALALDQGLIHPLSVLADAPISFGSYSPDNFDRDFRGPISSRDALRLSRNIPAIKLASQIHSPDLYDFLKQAGVRLSREKQDYGLSLVLGGGEVTMRELTELYAMLVNDGQLKRLKFRMDAPEQEPKKLLSGEASYITLDMLSDMPRRYTVESDRLVYWKTGTSNGFRDAWTVGAFGHYVLAVWVGNFRGGQNPALTGARAAAPLFFALADAVNEKGGNPDIVAEKSGHLNLRKVEVCATTGDLSLDLCPVRTTTWFIPGVSPIQSENVYRRILVNRKTGKRTCISDETKTAYRTIEVWPSDLRETLKKSGIQTPSIPAWDEGCGKAADNHEQHTWQKPVITSPQPNIVYHAHLRASENAIPLKANVDGEVKLLHWFADNQYVGSSHPEDAVFWKPSPGRYTLRVVDEHGNSEMVQVTVSIAQ